MFAAAGPSSPGAADALEKLCLAYWYPLYAYARRKGNAPDQAQDLTQAFFAELIEKKAIQAVDQSRGKFRSFLLTSFQNFMAKEHRKRVAQKRGGGARMYSLDFKDVEGRYVSIEEPSHELTPERLFEREWAKALLARVLDRLRAEFQAQGGGDRFEILSACLVDPDTMKSYADIAEQINSTEGAVKTAVHRMRRRYRQLYREEILCLVEHEDQVDEEIRHLLEALS